MFVVELAFDDSPERLAARPAHRELLRKFRDEGRIVMAGPFTDDTGGLLIFNVADESELDRLMDADPYYRTSGVTVMRRREWSPVVT